MSEFEYQIDFPDPRGADAEGLVAVGGDFSVPYLLAAYRNGIFPWSFDPVSWWSPDPRGIMELDQFYVSRTLRKVLKKELFEIRINTAFRSVMEACATTRKNGNWITREFIDAYEIFHQQGHAHCVECWQEGQLAGAVYGVAVGGVFAGESMFHRVNDASKVALYHLVQHLKERRFSFLDVQLITPTTEALGAIEIQREDYLQRLTDARSMKVTFI
ncbi:leucyl/phenylalanyl-tRNA--protein transferase [Verrucomicrobia bacterium]|nr:leucyl/phenylalanyl-tRNA--protein transferase [Verrucomicrobiota bacterium]